MRRIPLLHFGLTLLMGIVTDALYPVDQTTSMVILAVLWCLYLSQIVRAKDFSRHEPARKTLLIFLIAYTTGITSNGLQSSLRQKTKDPTEEILWVKIDAESGSRNQQKIFLSTAYSWAKNKSGKQIKIYVYADTITAIREGTVLLTLNKLIRIKKTANPGEFDFSKYAALNDVHHSLQIRNNAEFTLIQIQKNGKGRFLHNLRNKVLSIIRKQFDDKNEAGLAEAILLGYRKDLDRELIQNYLDTGVIHVIAISGMHLGLIFGLIDLLIKLIADKKRSKWAAFAISLPLLWIFALLTGGSASVLRSAIMFSLMILGAVINRRNYSLNGLAGAGLVLLLYDPDYWMDLGFQLSFLAVLSIMLFNKRILSWLYFRNPILKLTWNLVAVTIAAQVLTTPLVIYHFHRFPTLFLFTNLVAVPLSSILLLLEILLCIFHSLPFISGSIVLIIKCCMHMMNGYIGMMANVPFGMINNIYVSLLMAFTITLIFLCIWQVFLHPSKWLWRMIISLNLGAGQISLTEKIKQKQIKQIEILNIFHGSVLLHQHGKTGEIWVSEHLIDDPSVIDRILGICQNHGIRNFKWRKFPEKPLLISDNHYFSLLHNVDQSPDSVIRHLNNHKMIWITDGSMSMWKSREWQKAMQKLHLRFHSTRDEGPFTIDCPDSFQKR